MYYEDSAELTYHATPKGTYGHGTLTATFGRDICAKDNGSPKRWFNRHGIRWTLDSAHRNNNRFQPTSK